MSATEELSFLQSDRLGVSRVAGQVPCEQEVAIYVNWQELVSLMCTPLLVEELALGFLFNEGLIAGMDDVAVCRACGSERCVDVWLHRAVEFPLRRIVTSGCAGGTTFARELASGSPITSATRVTAAQIGQWMEQLFAAMPIFHDAGGSHASALVAADGTLVAAEDLGRHNSLDKVAGRCLREGIPLDGRVLLTTGRISSEMVRKAARMRTPILISRTSPTSLSVQLARAWNVTLVGYVRGRKLRVYTGEERVILPGGV